MSWPQVTAIPRVAFEPLEEREPQFDLPSIISNIFNPGGDDTSTSQTSSTSTSSTESTSSTSQSTQSTSSSSTRETTSSSSSSRTRETSTRPTSTYQPPTTRTTSTASVYTSQFTSGGSTVVQTLTSTIALVETLAPDPNAQQNTSSGGGSGNGGVVGGVVGGVIGGLAALVALVLLGILLKRRRDRTGHAYFLCLGTKPNRHLDGGDGDWPTFDPNSSSLASATGVGAAGAAFGAGSKRGRPATPGGTLPQGFDDPEALGGDASSNGASDMREWHNGAPAAAAAAAYARSRQESHGALSDGWSQPPLSASGPNGFGGPSDDGHHVLPAPAQQQALAGAGNAWGLPMGYSHPQATASVPSSASPPQNGVSGPDYGHLDPPEVQEQRAREAAAAAAAAGPSNLYSSSDLAHQQTGNSGYGSGSGGRPATASSNHGGDGIFSDAAAADAYTKTGGAPGSPRSYNKRQSNGSMMSLGGLAPPTYFGNNNQFVDAHSGTPTREDGEFQFSNPRRLAPTNPDA
ncbi:hypothetical protein CBOM_04233 [Ceraceosorus bombacis]|uniref:CTX-RELATED TYPE I TRANSMEMBRANE PROTEIN n=1 Tax=Ceraceosorus bombacis TaxID=401625 RepID=A0A0P1BQ33_9BASI|nr:hypothetical protein CBOM_04233 [Ceraceosorus bombacis]